MECITPSKRPTAAKVPTMIIAAMWYFICENLFRLKIAIPAIVSIMMLVNQFMMLLTRIYDQSRLL